MKPTVKNPPSRRKISAIANVRLEHLTKMADYMTLAENAMEACSKHSIAGLYELKLSLLPSSRRARKLFMEIHKQLEGFVNQPKPEIGGQDGDEKTASGSPVNAGGVNDGVPPGR